MEISDRDWEGSIKLENFASFMRIGFGITNQVHRMSSPKKSVSSSVNFNVNQAPQSASPTDQRRMSGPSGLVWRGSVANPPSPYKRKSLLTSVDENAAVDPTNFRENRKSLLKYNRPEASNEVEARLHRTSLIRAVSLEDINYESRQSIETFQGSFLLSP